MNKKSPSAAKWKLSIFSVVLTAILVVSLEVSRHDHQQHMTKAKGGSEVFHRL
jgi:hypothetical protein